MAVVAEAPISVVVPIATRRTSAASLERLLESLRRQSVPSPDVILVTDVEEEQFTALAQRFGATLLQCAHGKSAARNVGSSVARQPFVLHLDADNVLDANVLASCAEVLSNPQPPDAIVIPERLENARTFYAARKLERELYHRDPFIESPRLIRRELFESVGGFDERLDPIDEGALKEAILERGAVIAAVNAEISIQDERPVSRQARDKFERGQKAALFDAIYPGSLQLRPLPRLKHYSSRAAGLFVGQPHVFAQMVGLKLIDLVAFSLGKICAPRSVRIEVSRAKNARIFEDEARTYQSEFYESNIGGKTVGDREFAIVKQLLAEMPKDRSLRILDMGCGGGRWSELLLREFPAAHVTACDFSPTAVEEVAKRLTPVFGSRFDAKRGDFVDMPFTDETFDLILSIRAIKYASSMPKALSELRRILKPSGAVLLEFPYPNAVLRLLRLVPAGRLRDYARRITVLSPGQVRRSMSATSLCVERLLCAFTLPATLYKQPWVRSSNMVDALINVERMLPKPLFARSIFVTARAADVSSDA